VVQVRVARVEVEVGSEKVDVVEMAGRVRVMGRVVE
jgi:hypothetical protein